MPTQQASYTLNPMGVLIIGSLGFGLLMAMRAETESSFVRMLLAAAAFVVFGLTRSGYLAAKAQRQNTL